AATLVMRRSPPDEPTLTTLLPIAVPRIVSVPGLYEAIVDATTTLSLPSATAPSRPAAMVTLLPITNASLASMVLSLPNAYESAPVTELGSPNAPELAPLTTLPVPMLIESAPCACAPLPNAMLLPPVACAPLPSAMSAPTALPA